MVKLNKKIIIIALIFITFVSIMNTSHAIQDTSIYVVSPTTPNDTTSSKIGYIVSKVLGILTVFGVIVGVGGISIIGIQTILASAEEKAVYKQKILPFFIGLILLFAAATLVGTINRWVSSTPGNPETVTPPETPWDPTTIQID